MRRSENEEEEEEREKERGGGGGRGGREEGGRGGKCAVNCTYPEQAAAEVCTREHEYVCATKRCSDNERKGPTKHIRHQRLSAGKDPHAWEMRCISR
jgi:hypothetical protein